MLSSREYDPVMFIPDPARIRIPERIQKSEKHRTPGTDMPHWFDPLLFDSTVVSSKCRYLPLQPATHLLAFFVAIVFAIILLDDNLHRGEIFHRLVEFFLSKLSTFEEQEASSTTAAGAAAVSTAATGTRSCLSSCSSAAEETSSRPSSSFSSFGTAAEEPPVLCSDCGNTYGGRRAFAAHSASCPGRI